MTSPSIPMRRARAGTANTHEAADRLGTAGWAAKGVVYLVIGVLALQLAVAGGEEGETSKQGALEKVAEQPFGTALLVLTVIGLAAYVLYNLVVLFVPGAGGALASTGRAGGDDGKAWARDARHVGTALAYGIVAAQGVSLLMGRSQGGGDAQQKTWSAALLSSTIGTIVLGLVSLGLLAFGAYQIHKGVSRGFLEKLDCPSNRFPSRRTIEWTGVTGHVARGVVAGMLGIFVAVAIVRHDPNEVRGLDGSLRTLQQGPAGTPLLVLVALGLAAYGVFALISASCRRHEAG